MSMRLSEQIGVVATIDPDAYGAATHSTDVIDMANLDRVLFIVMAGTLGSSATIDFSVKGDTASGGSFTTALTDKAITQLTQAGTDDDKQALVEVTGDEVLAQGFRYIRGDMVVGTATSDAGVIAIGGHRRYSPMTDHDLASVDEVVT